MDISIELDKPRTLRYDIGAIGDLEAAYGKPLGGILHDLAQMGITVTVLCLLHGLAHEDRSLTPNAMKRILQTVLAEKRTTMDVIYKRIKLALDESGLFRTADEAPVGNGSAERVGLVN